MRAAKEPLTPRPGKTFALPSDPGSKTYSSFRRHGAADSRVLSGFEGERCLEIGFGSGAVLASLSGRFSLSVGTDVMPLDQARESARGRAAGVILADRASCFRPGAFDLVAFNPPYLPSEGFQDRAVDGGEGGVEVSIKFFDDALRVLKKDGRISPPPLRPRRPSEIPRPFQDDGTFGGGEAKEAALLRDPCRLRTLKRRMKFSPHFRPLGARLRVVGEMRSAARDS